MQFSEKIVFYIVIFLIIAAVSAYADYIGNPKTSPDNRFPHNVYWNVTDEIDIPVQNLKLPGVNPPSDDIIGETPVLSYDKAQNESAHGVMHVIPQYKEGSSWDVAFYWAPDDDSVGSVTWCVNATKIRYGINPITGGDSIIKCVTDNSNRVKYRLQKADLISFLGTDTINDDMFSFRIFRGADLITDTYDADAHLVMATIYYNSEKAGET